jgi:hypothetical protein
MLLPHGCLDDEYESYALKGVDGNTRLEKEPFRIKVDGLILLVVGLGGVQIVDG